MFNVGVSGDCLFGTKIIKLVHSFYCSAVYLNIVVLYSLPNSINYLTFNVVDDYKTRQHAC